jgi:hypothetical protein
MLLVLVEQGLDALDLALGGLQRSALRQPDVDHDLGPAGGREELLLHALVEGHQRQREDADRGADITSQRWRRHHSTRARKRR